MYDTYPANAEPLNFNLYHSPSAPGFTDTNYSHKKEIEFPQLQPTQISINANYQHGINRWEGTSELFDRRFAS